MPRSFDLATEYEGSVERVHRTLGSEEYWLARLADSGADDATLDSLEIGDDGSIDIVTTQVLRADRLPGLVTPFHRGDLAIQRDEKWSPVRDGQANATVKATIHGAPASASGTALLTPAKSGNGSRMEMKATVEVDIPLVGGKIEDFIGKALVDLLIAEQRFTTVWITENA